MTGILRYGLAKHVEGYPNTYTVPECCTVLGVFDTRDGILAPVSVKYEGVVMPKHVMPSYSLTSASYFRVLEHVSGLVMAMWV